MGQVTAVSSIVMAVEPPADPAAAGPGGGPDPSNGTKGAERAPAAGQGGVAAKARGAASRARRSAEAMGGRFGSPLHDEWVASVLGIALGVAFTVCFLTGLVDYLAQHPPHWFHLPAHPVNLYRVNEGVHVVTGIAAVPLLLAKLWTVWPKLFAWPPVRSAAHALERLSLVALVGGALFQLFTGVLNIDYWYSPMPFFFPTAHFWGAWLVIGALVVHIGSKGMAAAHAITRGPEPLLETARAPAAPGHAGTDARPDQARPGLTRRGFVATVLATAGLLVLTVAGETVAPLRKLALLAPRNPIVGPQSLPVNQSAAQAGVTETARDPSFTLAVTGNCRRPRTFTLADLQALPQREAGLPITCVEGWSASAQWRGISLPALLRMVDARTNAAVRVESLESADRLYSSSLVDAQHAADPDTLLALELNGKPLDIDHGYPVRLIAPDRPGVLQTKWVARVVVL